VDYILNLLHDVDSVFCTTEKYVVSSNNSFGIITRIIATNI